MRVQSDAHGNGRAGTAMDQWRNRNGILDRSFQNHVPFDYLALGTRFSSRSRFCRQNRGRQNTGQQNAGRQNTGQPLSLPLAEMRSRSPGRLEALIPVGNRFTNRSSRQIVTHSAFGLSSYLTPGGMVGRCHLSHRDSRDAGFQGGGISPVTSNGY